MLLDFLKGRGIKTRLLNPYDTFWDCRIGVNTLGFYPARGKEGDRDWQTHYVPTAYQDLFSLFRMVDLREDDVFVDLGCGLGRPVFAASWAGVKRSIGVEVVPDLCAAAMENRRRSRIADKDIQFICTNAMDYRYDGTTLLFMFHPFGENTLRQVLRSIETSRKSNVTPQLRVIYGNPVYDFVLEESGWLECFARIPPARLWMSTASRYVTSLWRSKS